MDAVWALVVACAHIAAAISAVVLALWLASKRPGNAPTATAAAVALGASALWALSAIGLEPDSLEAQGLISATYLAWLWTLYRFFVDDERHKSLAPIRPVVFALAFVEFMQIALVLPRLHYQDDTAAAGVILDFVVLFRLLFCIGALMLVHNLYVGASQLARQNLRWPAAALTALWLYDLNLYTIAYLIDAIPGVLAEIRGLAMLAAVALLAYGILRTESGLQFKPSRSFAFQSFSLLVIGAYLLMMVLAAQAMSHASSEFARLVQTGFVLLASIAAIAFLPSRRLRAWLRVTVSKHLFQHRYDYRAEWLRFTDTIGRAGQQASPLHERAVQAVADITDSPSGLLLTPRQEGGLALDACWQWPGIEVPAIAIDAQGVRFFEDTHFIVDLDDLRAGRQQHVPAAARPRWLMEDHSAWALVPLLHYERLVGLVVLARPPVARLLDWEDFDLLRIVGRQLASYLAEQASHGALGEAQRFEEFNRRMAFVMHDIKNLASQLSLLARNSEKHAGKPEFRADMILTLRKSTDKLQALLNRLGRYGAQGGGAREEVALNEVIGRVARQYEGKHDLITVDREACTIMADGEALEQALLHLVQNAVEASEGNLPVFLDLRCDSGNAIVGIVDSGCGMSPEFIRTRLFKPFDSSKPGGFGIGAFEARELIRAMGGRLDVESREGIGTRFLVRFPLSRTTNLMNSSRSEVSGTAEIAHG